MIQNYNEAVSADSVSSSFERRILHTLNATSTMPLDIRTFGTTWIWCNRAGDVTSVIKVPTEVLLISQKGDNHRVSNVES